MDLYELNCLALKYNMKWCVAVVLVNLWRTLLLKTRFFIKTNPQCNEDVYSAYQF